jgi:hypothetical protein
MFVRAASHTKQVMYLVAMQIRQSLQDANTVRRNKAFRESTECLQGIAQRAVFHIFQDDVEVVFAETKAFVLDYVWMRQRLEQFNFFLLTHQPESVRWVRKYVHNTLALTIISSISLEFALSNAIRLTATI